MTFWALHYCTLADLFSIIKRMKKILNTFKRAKANNQGPLISFEIFPPKGTLTLDSARETASQLVDLHPDFISVTYSAGGSNNGNATNDIAALLQDELDMATMAHLTCVNATKESIANALEDLQQKGIENVLALRGDLVQGQKASESFHYAIDLIPLLKEKGFCVGAAAYPEGHPTVLDPEVNIEHLKAKQDAGADFFVTQLFFDNEVFYRFWDKALNAGITAPITCGIMPFMSKDQVQRMVFMCGASLPGHIVKILTKYENDKESLLKAGIEYAAQQLIDLAEHGVDGLHLYTMNKPEVARTCMKLLRETWQ